MKDGKSRALMVFTAILSVLCITAVAIAIYVSTILLNRQNQIVKSASDREVKAAAQDGEKILNINKGEELTLYYNGEKITGVNSYLFNKKNCFLPLDVLFDKAGINYSYFNSDDIIEAVVQDKKALIRLWKKSYQNNGSEVALPQAPIAAKGHVLGPVEILTGLDDFKVESDNAKKLVFVNYYPDYAASVRLKLLRTEEGKVKISDLPEGKLYWESEGGAEENETFYLFDGGKGCVIRSGDKMYVVRNGKSVSSYRINVDPSATLSADGKYLYWEDKSKRTSFIYNLESGRVKNIGDYAFRAQDAQASGSAANQEGEIVYDRLFDYKEGSGFKRIVLTDAAFENKYVFIQRKGKVVVEGSVKYSPNMKKVLYSKAGKGYYVSNLDGTGIVLLGEAQEAQWVGNGRVLLRTGDGMYIVDSNGQNRTRAEAEYRTVGQTSKGEAFFVKGNTLYCEEGETERKIADLPWRCEYVYGLSPEGPYVAVSDDSEDGVFYLNGRTAVKAGKKSLLLRNLEGGRISPDFVRSIISSPDRGSIAVLQRENGYIALHIFRTGGDKPQEVLLNCRTNEQPAVDPMSVRWVSQNRLVAYTDEKGWVVDLTGDGAKIYQWTEKWGSTLQGILP
ncbi:MAG: hypothetical protein QHH06_15310 [Clostridiales bacterium]|nr:hypothetical protein [Eubacteriales bacterium]MDH7567803.1 hypothetical protein [Clostridiales bacterium]